MKKRGRPSLFRKELIREIERLAGYGHTKAEIADVFGVSVMTLDRWAKRNPDFCYALKRGEARANEQVVKSLFKRAVGYKYREVTIERSRINPKRKVQKVIIKEVAPDTTAQIFWLKNRWPNKWRDKQEEINVNVSAQASTERSPLKDFSEVELREIVRAADYLSKLEEDSPNGQNRIGPE